MVELASEGQTLLDLLNNVSEMSSIENYVEADKISTYWELYGNENLLEKNCYAIIYTGAACNDPNFDTRHEIQREICNENAMPYFTLQTDEDCHYSLIETKEEYDNLEKEFSSRYERDEDDE